MSAVEYLDEEKLDKELEKMYWNISNTLRGKKKGK